MATNPKRKTLHEMFGVSRAMEAALLSSLPLGAERYFTVIKAGNRLGLRIACSQCGERPPQSLSGYRKWRWMSVHISQHGLRVVK